MRSLFVFCALLISLSSQAKTYYFSTSDGDDSRSSDEAQNSKTPWKSLEKLNSNFNSFTAGDQILFKRGDVFYGSINVEKSGNSSAPISFSAYGNGNKPIITGFASLSGWSAAGQNIWQTTNSLFGSSVNMVVINGVAKRVGRYPNYNSNTDQGFLYFEDYSGNTSITDSKISAQNFSGGDVVIRKNRWVVDKNKITQQLGSVLNYTSQSGYSPDKGYGYFIQNHINTLDQEGEWYYNPQEKKLGIFTAGGVAALQNVEASAVNILVTVNNQSNIVFDNLTFTGSNNQAFYLKNSKNVSLTNCDILFSGENAITADNTDYLTVQNSNIDRTNNVALNGIYCTNTVLKNDKITNTGVFAGMGDGDAGSYEAIMLTGDNNLVEQNSIDSTGYIPITFSGNNVTIKNNYISNYAFIKDDGGAIYTWNNSSNAQTNYGRKVTGNIVVNGIGAAGGTNDKTKKYAHGIYIDDNSANVDILDNTVANCEGFGLYIHNSKDLTIKSNTVYNNQVQLEMQHDDIAPNSPISNITLTDNILFSLQATQPVAEYKTKDDDLKNFGNFDNNYYCRPIEDNAVINTLKQVNGNYQFNPVDLDGWKAMYGKDANSNKTPKQIAAYKINEITGSNKFSNGSFTNDIGGLYSYAAANNFSSQWNNGAIDGGSLQVSFSNIAGNNNKGTIIINVGAVSANKSYILRFSSKNQEVNKMLEVYLRKSLSPYTDLTDRKLTKISGSRAEAEFLFVPTESEPNASIGIDVPEQSGSIYLDNIQLLEANVTPVNVQDSVRFIYNPNNTASSFSLQNSFVDVKNNSYNGSISLNAFSSSILLNKANNSTASVSTPCSATGNILHESWTNVNGNDISSETWKKAATSSSFLNAFEAPENAGTNYASRIRGYICPPQTGNYTFWIAGDDATELWLSIDDNPDNKVKIACSLSWTNSREWNKSSSQKSVQIYLQAGKKYYIEALHQQGEGGDNFAVAWQLPDGTFEGPISGSHLSPFTTTQVALTTQVIFFSGPADVTYGVAPFPLSATSSSNLPVSFRVVSGPATVTDNTLTVTGAGAVTLEASQPGNEVFSAAPTIEKTFNVLQQPSVQCSATGTILHEVWNNVSGNNIADNVWTTKPNTSDVLTIFEGPENAGDNYASRIRGYICPPQTGNYTFWIAGDDASELWISTDDNPSNKTKIAYSLSWEGSREWDRFSTQKSALIYLEAGKKYYIEALHKQGNGGNNIAVAWQFPDGTKEAPISGRRLSPYIGPPITLTDQTINFDSINDVTFGVAPFIISATSTSNLPVSFKVTSGPATISGNTLTVASAGVVTIEASQPGNDYFNTAPVVIKTFNVIPPSLTECSATGTILREVWNNVNGNNIDNNSWTNTPSSTSIITSFEGPANDAENYASRIRGYICAPQTGTYTFWIAGDDATELWLSTDDDPNNKIKIAYSVSWTNPREWEKYSTQRSMQINLKQGKKYYVEALHKQGGGGTSLAVAWQLPNGEKEMPISGNSLSPFTSGNAAKTISNAQNHNIDLLFSNSLGSKNIITPNVIVYPNPASSIASIQIQTTEAGQVAVKLYNLQGAIVTSIFEGFVEKKATKSFTLPVKNLSAGVYFVKYLQNKKVLTARMIVVK